MTTRRAQRLATGDEKNADDDLAAVEEEKASPPRRKNKRSRSIQEVEKSRPEVISDEEDKEDGGESDVEESASKKNKTKVRQNKDKERAKTSPGDKTPPGSTTTGTSTSKVEKKSSPSEKDGEDEFEEVESPKKKSTAAQHQMLTERDHIRKLWNASDHNDVSYTCKIASWNVAGLRALMKNHPSALSDLVTQYNLDVLCLQETKLQESHLDDPKLKIREELLVEEGYDAHYSCSTAKKGYSGTAVFVRRRRGGREKGGKKQQKLDTWFQTAKTKAPKKKKESSRPSSRNDGKHAIAIEVDDLIPQEVSMKMGKEQHDAEGRLITLDFPLFTMTNVYVPNAGQKLERLGYRTEQWDKDLLAYMQAKAVDRKVPVFWLGDLNVAHTNLEVWNDGAKHLPKQAGVTPQERASFQAQLDAGFVDAFRRLHPDAKGHYSYWSTRAGNRGPNKGLRLDYFICSPDLFQGDKDDSSSRVVVRDSYILPEVVGSDHCPVVLELQIKQERTTGTIECE